MHLLRAVYNMFGFHREGVEASVIISATLYISQHGWISYWLNRYIWLTLPQGRNDFFCLLWPLSLSIFWGPPAPWYKATESLKSFIFCNLLMTGTDNPKQATPDRFSCGPMGGTNLTQWRQALMMTTFSLETGLQISNGFLWRLFILKYSEETFFFFCIFGLILHLLNFTFQFHSEHKIDYQCTVL